MLLQIVPLVSQITELVYGVAVICMVKERLVGEVPPVVAVLVAVITPAAVEPAPILAVATMVGMPTDPVLQVARFPSLLSPHITTACLTDDSSLTVAVARTRET